jgi:hypothetical protein
MSDRPDESKAKKDPSDISDRDCSRSRQEGAFISPFGTEGCQWDGFPEPPDYDGETLPEETPAAGEEEAK